MQAFLAAPAGREWRDCDFFDLSTDVFGTDGYQLWRCSALASVAQQRRDVAEEISPAFPAPGFALCPSCIPHLHSPPEAPTGSALDL